MEDKNNEQMKLEVQEWQVTNALVGILGILAPAACLAFILRHSGILLDFILHIDNSKPKALPHHFHRWLTALIFWPLRSHPPRSISKSHRHADTRNPVRVWRDGSLLCTLVNMAVPGACKDPREHRLQPPKHGMKLVMEYLDIQPIFTQDELNQPHLTPQQETKFAKYLHEVHHLISNQTDNINNMRYSTDYVARGMGLVIGEQNRKSTFYIYPIPKHNQQPCDLEVTIKGPCGNNGHIIIPSILHHQQKWQPPTEYRRAMYMSSKLNSISPTMQGTSFLRRLSLTSIKPQDPSLEIDVRVKISSTRAKVSYVPQKTGVYEVSLVTRNCHVVGSPYSVPIETATSCNYISNDSDNESSEEKEGRYIKRKRKIISRIVDFIDEKMLLQNDGTLVKINDGKLLTQKLNEITNEQYKTEIIKPVKIKEINLLETDNLRENSTNKENSTSSNIQRMSTIDMNKIQSTSQNDPVKKLETKFNFTENIPKFNENITKPVKDEASQNVNKVKQDLSENNLCNEDISPTNCFEAKTTDNTTENNSSNDRQAKEISNKHDFHETLNKFNTTILKEETNLLYNNKKSENDSNKEATKTKDSKIQIDTPSNDIQHNEIKSRNNFEESLTSNEESFVRNNSELNSPDKSEENNNITFNISKSLDNITEPNYFSEANININDLDDTTKLNNSLFFAPDILEASNKTNKKSAPFTTVNKDQISNNYSQKSSIVDPTLLVKVHDPALDFSTRVSEHRKTFSKKDPSKDLIFLTSNTTEKKNYLVNNLVKVFDVPPQEYSSSFKQSYNENSSTNEEKYLQNCSIHNISPGNDPDLVQCHTKNISSSNAPPKVDYYSVQKDDKNGLHETLKLVGAFSEDQCYLKSLQQSFEQQTNKNNNQICQQDIKQNTENHNNVKLGIVDKQKEFWNQKTNNYNGQCFNNNATKQKIILKDSFVVETKEYIKDKKSDLQCFEGIVENNIKIFETKLTSSTTNPATNPAPKKEILQLQKSKSESLLQQPKENKMYQIQKTLSDEEIIKLPSIEERRNKFLQACQQSLVSDGQMNTGKKSEITTVSQSDESTNLFNPEYQNLSTIVNQVSTNTLNEIPKETMASPKKKDKKLSFKRKARFKRAKLFFHHLEGSNPKINIEEYFEPGNLSKSIKISRSESDSCVSYEPTDPLLKSLKISDRFQVDDLFQDILGDDKRFIGIPNKMAVVASLASLDSSQTGYDSENEGETDMDYFTGKPKKITRKKKTIPGFHEEYPHLPTTDTWRYKSRNDVEEGELIPGRVLLTDNETDLSVT